MSLRDVIAEASNFEPQRYAALTVGGEVIGWIRPEMAGQLSRWPRVFECTPARVALRPATPAARSDALADVVCTLARENQIRGWRDERYTIRSPASGVALFALERAAVRAFGLTGRAAHLNGYVRGAGGWRMWIAQRSAAKPIDPGMLDNLVGGGIAEGMDAEGTLVKECAEEAGIPAALAAQARAAGTLRVTCSVPDGVHDEILHVYDLELHPDFVPENRDGEVERFLRLAPAELIGLVGAGRFTVDAALVAVDFMARNRALRPDRALDRLLEARRI